MDVLVEFESGYTPGFGFVRLQREISELLGYEVDLHTYRSLSRISAMTYCERPK